jgi:hypothetical protein
MTWNMARNPEKREKYDALCRTWTMVRKLKNVENDTQTLFVLEYG